MTVAEYKGSTAMKVPTEDAECMWLVEWAKMTRWNGAPIAEVLILVPNGAYHGADREAGAVVARKLSQKGLQAGVFDYLIPVPTIRTGYIYTGLWLEMKRTKGGVVSDEQKTFRDRMLRYGWKCEVAKGWIAASKVIEAYLQGVTP